MVDAPVAVAVDPSRAPATLSGYRTVHRAGAVMVVAVGVHIDLAEELSDAALADLVRDLLLGAGDALPDDGEASAPSQALRSLHAEAARTGRYFSAAVAVWQGTVLRAARCGRATIVSERGHQVQTLAPPEVMAGGRSGVLTNALGVPEFRQPPEVEARLDEGRIGIGVGFALDETTMATLAELPAASPAVPHKGGIALLFGPGRYTGEAS
jgi:hypothetical protein